MTSQRSFPPRGTRPVLIGAALAAGAAGVAITQRRHLRAIASDPDFLALTAPLDGVALDPIVSADGTRLHAERFGPEHAPATLVLAHGWTENLTLWGPIIQRLGDERLRIVAFDLRGHGGSSVAHTGDYAIERFGEDLEAVLAAVDGDPGHTAVAGHSLGAMSVAAWAARHDVRARIAAAALINTGLSELLGGALVLGEIGARLTPQWASRTMLSSQRRMLPVSTPVSLAATRRIAFGPDASDGMVAALERMVTDTDAHARGATGLALSTLDLSAAITRITVPTLVVAGDRDRLTPLAHAERIESALPRPTGLVVLERTGHMSPLERPDEDAAALTRLLGETAVLAG